MLVQQRRFATTACCRINALHMHSAYTLPDAAPLASSCGVSVRLAGAQGDEGCRDSNGSIRRMNNIFTTCFCIFGDTGLGEAASSKRHDDRKIQDDGKFPSWLLCWTGIDWTGAGLQMCPGSFRWEICAPRERFGLQFFGCALLKDQGFYYHVCVITLETIVGSPLFSPLLGPDSRLSSLWEKIIFCLPF